MARTQWPPIIPSSFRVAQVVTITIKDVAKVDKEIAQMFLRYNVSRTDFAD